MKINISTILFLSTLISGTMIVISSKSWILMWMGLEMNLLSFIPLMNQNKTPYENEAAMKYFIVQAMASLIMLFSILAAGLYEISNAITNTILLSSLFTKMGAAPFHLWFPGVMQGLTWMNCFILMTWQKIAPMIMMMYQLINGLMSNTIIMISVLAGAIGGFNQTSLRKMMAYSSISHLGWMIMASMMSIKYWIIYFMIYLILNLSIIIIFMKNMIFYLPQIFTQQGSKTNKFSMYISMLSLGGLPPFLGFFPKWLIIQTSMEFESKWLILIMVMTTMVTLYFYLKVTYSSLLFSNQNMYWKHEYKMNFIMILSLSISLMGIPIITYMSMY
uniref:NADH-ubiquinone oxidoreductase chain 2 n=1 Tax=Coeliccia cyanomelas TaxID=476659 RepID=A0A6C0R1X7_9ODON|nr:NADH dehydrogenase subunit 2 [Coeliccia cyanomelas]